MKEGFTPSQSLDQSDDPYLGPGISKFPLSGNDGLLSFGVLLETFAECPASLRRWCLSANTPQLIEKYTQQLSRWKSLGCPYPGEWPCRNTAAEVEVAYDQLKAVCDRFGT